MTIVESAISRRTGRAREARLRHYVMCRPTHFTVTYAINAWMDPTRPVDPARALAQWETLVDVYRCLGHRVDLLEPEADLPDMVFAANGAVVVGDRAYGARFKHPQRTAEAVAHAEFLARQGLEVVTPVHVNEGEGDFLVLDRMILAGTGFRTSLAAHIEAAEVLDRPVVSLELVDPRFYHLDTALAVLDDGGGAAPADIAYVPEAFSAHSRRTLRDLFPDALVCSVDDALVLGLNLVSDGRNVVLPAEAAQLARSLHERGYVPLPIHLDEFLKSGGSIKCCTQELHPA